MYCFLLLCTQPSKDEQRQRTDVPLSSCCSTATSPVTTHCHPPPPSAGVTTNTNDQLRMVRSDSSISTMTAGSISRPSSVTASAPMARSVSELSWATRSSSECKRKVQHSKAQSQSWSERVSPASAAGGSSPPDCHVIGHMPGSASPFCDEFSSPKPQSSVFPTPHTSQHHSSDCPSTSATKHNLILQMAPPMAPPMAAPSTTTISDLLSNDGTDTIVSMSKTMGYNLGSPSSEVK